MTRTEAHRRIKKHKQNKQTNMKLRKIHKDNEILAKRDACTDQRLHKIEQVTRQRQRNLMVVMEDVYNPYNLAAIARSCDAFGVQFLGAILQNSKNFDPREVANIAATSASKWLNYTIYEHGEGTEKVLKQLKLEGWHIVATVAPNVDNRVVHSIYDVDFCSLHQSSKKGSAENSEETNSSSGSVGVSDDDDEKLVLLIGNEHTGLSQTAIDCSDTLVTIPMAGMLQSFNVSVATAICLFEITRQRKMTGQYEQRYLFDEEDSKTLTDDFIMRK